MRRIVVTLMSTLSALVLLFSYHTSLGGGTTPIASAPVAAGPAKAGGSTPTTSPSTGSSSSSSTTTKKPATKSTTTAAAQTYTGDAVDTQWGVVQVQIKVQGGKITDAQAVQYPQNNGRDLEINSYAVPQLNTEAVQANSGRIDAVSGATVTSGGYIQSLQSAVDQAHL